MKFFQYVLLITCLLFCVSLTTNAQSEKQAANSPVFGHDYTFWAKGEATGFSGVGPTYAGGTLTSGTNLTGISAFANLSAAQVGDIFLCSNNGIYEITATDNNTNPIVTLELLNDPVLLGVTIVPSGEGVVARPTGRYGLIPEYVADAGAAGGVGFKLSALISNYNVNRLDSAMVTLDEVLLTNAAPVAPMVAEIVVDTLGVDSMYINNNGIPVLFSFGGGGGVNANITEGILNPASAQRTVPMNGQILIINDANDIRFNGSGEYGYGNGAGTNLPATDSDGAGKVQSILDADGNVRLIDRRYFDVLSGPTAPINGDTTAWRVNQLYIHEGTNTRYRATTASTDPDVSAAGSVWEPLPTDVEYVITDQEGSTTASSNQVKFRYNINNGEFTKWDPDAGPAQWVLVGSNTLVPGSEIAATEVVPVGTDSTATVDELYLYFNDAQKVTSPGTTISVGDHVYVNEGISPFVFPGFITEFSAPSTRDSFPQGIVIRKDADTLWIVSEGVATLSAPHGQTGWTFVYLADNGGYQYTAPAQDAFAIGHTVGTDQIDFDIPEYLGANAGGGTSTLTKSNNTLSIGGSNVKLDTFFFTKTAHGIADPGTGLIPVNFNGANISLADANDPSDDRFIDAYVVDVPDANTLVLATGNGAFYAPGHPYTIGMQYYLSETAGGFTTTSPTKSQPAFKVLDANWLMIITMRPVDETGTGADNLGNHIATQNIQLSGNYLSNDGDNEGIQVDNAGLVNIGGTTFSQALNVDGRVNVDDGNGNVIVSNSTVSSATGTGNTFIGNNAGRLVTTSLSNTLIGAFAGQTTTGGFNTVLGSTAGANFNGSNNTFLGYLAGGSVGSASGLIYIGANAGQNGGGSNNIGIGNSSLTSNTGNDNVAVGPLSMQSATGNRNTAVGAATLQNSQAGISNTAVGYHAGQFVSGDNNLLIGDDAGRYSVSSGGVYLGKGAFSFGNGDTNFACGSNAGGTIVGDNNIALGADAFNDAVDNGNQKTFANTDINTGTNQITITGHGFMIGEKLPFKFTTAGTEPTGLVANNNYQFEVIDANTLQAVSTTITTQGTGTHTLTPFLNISNSTALGSQVNPTASNQVAVGNSSVTQMLLGENITWSWGAGSPEGVITAPPGSLYSNTSGGAGTTLYVKETGTGNTGWAAK